MGCPHNIFLTASPKHVVGAHWQHLGKERQGASVSTTCFCGEIRKYHYFPVEKSTIWSYMPLVNTCWLKKKKKKKKKDRNNTFVAPDKRSFCWYLGMKTYVCGYYGCPQHTFYCGKIKYFLIEKYFWFIAMKHSSLLHVALPSPGGWQKMTHKGWHAVNQKLKLQQEHNLTYLTNFPSIYSVTGRIT